MEVARWHGDMVPSNGMCVWCDRCVGVPGG